MTDFEYLHKTDPPSIFARQAIKAVKANKTNSDSKIVLLRAFVGGSRQEEHFKNALAHAATDLFKDHGITLNCEILNNDEVKWELKWNVTKLTDWLLSSDVHLIPCHIHQGNLGKTTSWNIENITANASRLRSHLGLPMGQHVDCPVWLLDKFQIYKRTEGFSTPTMRIELQPEILSSSEVLHEIEM
jgi:hypothetical protein